jgi:hypothetical protein
MVDMWQWHCRHQIKIINFPAFAKLFQARIKQGLDSIKVGSNMILINPMGVCYWELEMCHYVLVNCNIPLGGGGPRYVAHSSEQAPHLWDVGSILTMDSCEKSQSMLCQKSWVFSGCSGFLPQGKLTGWVRIIKHSWESNHNCCKDK